MRDPVDTTRLYQTLDGGKSWQRFSPSIEQAAEIELQRVDLPTKWQSGEMLIPAWITTNATEAEFGFLRVVDGTLSQAGEAIWSIDAGAINPQSWQELFGSELAFKQLSSFDGENF